MIHLLWCTIRVDMFKKSHEIWIENSNNKDFLSHILVSTNEEKELLQKYFDKNKLKSRITIYKPPYIGVCLPSYKLSSTLEYKDDDIIIFASDDFTPPKGWDDYLINKLDSKDNSVLMVRDGYQKPDSSNMLHPAITIPIMKGGGLNKLNKIIYNPVYHHMFSDCELYQVSKDLGILIDDRLSDDTTFTHHHHAYGKRPADEFDKIFYSDWKIDEKTWELRKSMSLEEKIKINIEL